MCVPSFNYHTFSPESANTIIEALNQVMTPPFGTGGRLVWLPNTTLYQQCPENVLKELQRTLEVIPPDSYLLLTNCNKPDMRLRSTKLLKQFATKFQDFSLIPPWKTDALVQAVQNAAHSVGVKLTSQSAEFLAECVGNNTRMLYNELEKLRLYAGDRNQPLDVKEIARLVSNATRNSLQLAKAIRTGNTAKSLVLIAELLHASEPALKIVATLVGQFRTWLWVKIITESGVRDQIAIAKVADIANPKRIYFLQQEVQALSIHQLTSTLPILLALEVSLKQGANESSTLKTKIVELCKVCCRD